MNSYRLVPTPERPQLKISGSSSSARRTHRQIECAHEGRTKTSRACSVAPELVHLARTRLMELGELVPLV